MKVLAHFLLSFATLLLSVVALAGPPEATLEEIRKNYNPTINVVVEGTDRGGRSGCSMRQLAIRGEDPYTKQSRPVRVTEYYRGDERQRIAARTIIVVPPTGGVNNLDEGYSSTFCTEGFRVLLVYGWEFDDSSLGLELETQNIASLRALVALKHVVEYANPTREKQLGVFGTSLGGLMASLLVGEDRRVAAAGLVVAGGIMPEIVAHTDEKNMSRLREARFRAYGYRDEMEYEAALRQVMRYDNQDLAQYTGAKPIWMSIALEDTKVPTKNQFDLQRAWNTRAEDTMRVSGSHVEVIMRTFFAYRNDVTKFFQRELQ